MSAPSSRLPRRSSLPTPSCTAFPTSASCAAPRIRTSSCSRRSPSAIGRSRSPTNARSRAWCARTWPPRARPLKLLIGSEFRLSCGLKLVALAINRQGYGAAVPPHHPRPPPGAEGHLSLEPRRCGGGAAGAVLHPVDPRGGGRARRSSRWLAAHFPARAWIAVELLREGRRPRAAARSWSTWARSTACRSWRRATCTCTCARRRKLQDMLTAIRARRRRSPRPGARCIRTPSATCALRAPRAALSGASCWRRRWRSPRRCHFCARRAALRIPAGAGARGRDAGELDLRKLTEAGRALALAAAACRRRCARRSSTSSR